MRDSTERRERMVREQVAARGVRDDRVLDALRNVPREEFVAPTSAEFAYEDAALPIAEGQTISQPYIVAVMAEALELKPGDRVLDVGTGSGYAAAVLAQIVDEVYTVERHAPLAASARERFRRLGLDNIHVRVGDGTRGWEEAAPFDAINVAAGGPDVPRSLLEQLAPGGRMIIPTGEPAVQKLVRVRRTDSGFEREGLGAVRFVPLIGAEGWTDPDPAPPTVSDRIAAAAEPFDGIEAADLDALLDRIGDARVVLLGEATHGTSEFYRMRARITRELVERKGFRIVAVEADWPDAGRIDGYIRHREAAPPAERPFTRFPTWMWVNEEVSELVSWLRDWNESRSPEDRVGFHGLDLYSLYASIGEVLRYLDEVDPEAATVARHRYGCLTPWQADAATYGRAVLTDRYRSCEEDVAAALRDLLRKRLEYQRELDGGRYFDAEQNARVVANAERYYRIMYYGGRQSWNLRDQHMFDTLQSLLAHRGDDARAIVWAHNSHLGNAAATEMSARGEHNVGQLCREAFGDAAYLVGFGTHAGTVAAAHNWGDEVEIMDVRPSHERSYERLCHDAGVPTFLLPLRIGASQHAEHPRLIRTLEEERLERAIGVIYRPATELQSHYFHASLPRQFDEYIWFDHSEAVTPLSWETAPEEVPETYPFGV